MSSRSMSLALGGTLTLAAVACGPEKGAALKPDRKTVEQQSHVLPRFTLESALLTEACYAVAASDFTLTAERDGVAGQFAAGDRFLLASTQTTQRLDDTLVFPTYLYDPDATGAFELLLAADLVTVDCETGAYEPAVFALTDKTYYADSTLTTEACAVAKDSLTRGGEVTFDGSEKLPDGRRTYGVTFGGVAPAGCPGATELRAPVDDVPLNFGHEELDVIPLGLSPVVQLQLKKTTP